MIEYTSWVSHKGVEKNKEVSIEVNQLDSIGLFLEELFGDVYSYPQIPLLKVGEVELNKKITFNTIQNKKISIFNKKNNTVLIKNTNSNSEVIEVTFKAHRECNHGYLHDIKYFVYPEETLAVNLKRIDRFDNDYGYTELNFNDVSIVEIAVIKGGK